MLWDGVRVLTRIMQRAHDEYGTTRTNFKRRAKRRSIAILNAGWMARRLSLYRDLLKVTRKTVQAAEAASKELRETDDIAYGMRLDHCIPLVKRVIAQTERRVLNGESVPAEEKLVSIFDALLSTGRSGLVLDLVVERGNPCDSTLTIRSAERHKELFDVAPEGAAFDGGFASKANHQELKVPAV